MPITITAENFQTEVVKSEMPVLIDFWAPWCGPCRMVSPIVDELEGEFEGNIKVVKINVDDEPEIASKFNVMSIPTLAVIKDGEVSATAVGARPKEDLKQLLGLV
jgi:thioredoxin 1